MVDALLWDCRASRSLPSKPHELQDPATLKLPGPARSAGTSCCCSSTGKQGSRLRQRQQRWRRRWMLAI